MLTNLDRPGAAVEFLGVRAPENRSQHKLVLATKVDGSAQYARPRLSPTGGGWLHSYRCPECGKERRYMDNYVGNHQVRCDGKLHVAGRKRL